ncbi:hypothetical protein C0J52_09439 [Blattella germanica]|nr:hypothetical protein C0J52_09439 [Blattella germanica]
MITLVRYISFLRVLLPILRITSIVLSRLILNEDILCIKQVCHCLGISKESDYFGLKYHGTKGEELWLNLRNPIERQVGGIPPHRFALRVKFWVPPHLLLQDSTRHQFYLHARLDLLEGRLKVNDWNVTAKLIALMVQAETGDFDPVVSPQPHGLYLEQGSQLGAGEDSKPPDFLNRVAVEHKELKGMKASTAEYWLLKEASNLDSFGEEFFHSKPSAEGNVATCLGVGPHGISLYHGEGLTEKLSIPYTAIQTAASQRRLFHLAYADVDGHDSSLQIKLESSQAASGLYRAITEKHAFYSCETVRSAVTAQFIRDLKSTRTQLVRLLEAMYCRICMDRAIDTAFFPCAHVMACAECGARCDRCPLCRAPIQHSRRIFLPMELQDADHLLKQPQNTNKNKNQFQECNGNFHESNLPENNSQPLFHQQRRQWRNGNSQSQEQTSSFIQSSNGSVIPQQLAPYATEEVMMDES